MTHVDWHPYPEEKPPYGFDLIAICRVPHLYSCNGNACWGFKEEMRGVTYGEFRFARLKVIAWAYRSYLEDIEDKNE